MVQSSLDSTGLLVAWFLFCMETPNPLSASDAYLGRTCNCCTIARPVIVDFAVVGADRFGFRFLCTDALALFLQDDTVDAPQASAFLKQYFER